MLRLPRLAALLFVLSVAAAGCGRSVPSICADHSDCDPAESCVAQRCRVAGYPCEADADCPGDEICVEAACVEAPECLEDADCGPEMECVVGTCAAAHGGGAG